MVPEQWIKGRVDKTEPLIDQIDKMEVQNEDVFVASFPKSGTTWLQHVVLLLYNQYSSDTESFSWRGENIEWRFPFLEHQYPGIEEINERKGQKR